MRADLLALTVETLTRLANVGLVKRAIKEIDAGIVPTLVEDKDGTVVASARDGASTRLARGIALQHTSCTCGASQVCRHRIAAVLAYQAATPRDAALNASPASATQASIDPRWNPGTIGDDELIQACGAALVARALATKHLGLVVTTIPGIISATGVIGVPTVMLPTATVQFLVPDNVAYAKCDCAKGQGCEHVVLAVYAFRCGPDGGMYTLGDAAVAGPAALTSTIDLATVDIVYAALTHIATYGVTAPGSQKKLVAARGAVQRQGWLWIVDGLETIERLADAYHRQSASFQLVALAREVGEVVARLRAATAAPPALPARWLLGCDQAAQTTMEQVRLLSLGARLDADDDRRMVRMYFADPDTATVLVLDKTWANETRNGPDLGQLYASSRMSVTNLAQGELVTRAARRQANGALDLSAARGMRASLLPSTGSWDSLPAPLLVRDLATWAERRGKQPPTCLVPRSLGAGIVVVPIKQVVRIALSQDRQSVTAIVNDAAGHALELHTQHRTVSPGAVDATVQALRTPASHVAGALQRNSRGWYMAPLAFYAKQVVVIDLQRPNSPNNSNIERGRHDTHDTHRHHAPRVTNQLDDLVTALADYLGRSVLKGQRATANSASQLAQQAEQLAMHHIAALCNRAANGDLAAWFDLTVLYQLE
ncbi:MAG: hypothetical protein KBG15_04930 [Kofleriaceae bacterium]|nr:hypothetical protein [Kofleriaceae bacterium]